MSDIAQNDLAYYMLLEEIKEQNKPSVDDVFHAAYNISKVFIGCDAKSFIKELMGRYYSEQYTPSYDLTFRKIDLLINELDDVHIMVKRKCCFCF